MNQYHPKLLEIFTYEQFELLADHSHCYGDKDELIHILYSSMDFGHYEIYCDCEAKKLDHAVIYVQFNTTWEGENWNDPHLVDDLLFRRHLMVS